MNEIITMNATGAAALPEFKNQKLMEAAKKIQAIYNNAAKYAEAKNREVAVILSNLKANKSYVDDGFKSVADFAEKTFGIKKQNAYALAVAGDVYNDETASEALKAMSPSKVAEIANVKREEVEKALADGTITKDTTQKALREFKEAHTTSESGTSSDAEVIKQYVARPLIPFITDDMAAWLNVGLTMEELDKKFCNYIVFCSPREGEHRDPEIIKLPKSASYKTPNGKKKLTIRKLYISDTDSIAVEFYEYRPVPAKEPEKVPYTKAQLLAMLKAIQMEEEAAYEDENDDGMDQAQ